MYAIFLWDHLSDVVLPNDQCVIFDLSFFDYLCSLICICYRKKSLLVTVYIIFYSFHVRILPKLLLLNHDWNSFEQYLHSAVACSSRLIWLSIPTYTIQSFFHYLIAKVYNIFLLLFELGSCATQSIIFSLNVFKTIYTLG